MNYHDLVASDNPQASQQQINERLTTQNNLIIQQNLRLEKIENELKSQGSSANKQSKKSNALNIWVLVLSAIGTLSGIVSCILACVTA